MAPKVKRMNISIPKQVADELSQLVPPGRRSRLIAEATEKELQKMKRLKVLKRSAGAWTNSNHPDLRTIEDICAWVDCLWKFDESRFSKLTGHS